VSKVEEAFSDEFSDEEFEKLFDRKKPNKEDYLIFTCRTGNRSNQAIQKILPFGYTK
jgi:rhodanese-related sulfurtransferase